MSEYRTKQGDTWDIIAKRELGSEHLMPRLMELNFAQRLTSVFPEGVMLKLPEITTQERQEVELNLPPWKR